MKTKLILALTLLTATPLFAAVDQNYNGLSDVYEFIYFGGPTDPFADPDGDGLLDIQEFQQGHDPGKKDHPAVGLLVFTPLEK